jgi:hypothetical protein
MMSTKAREREQIKNDIVAATEYCETKYRVRRFTNNLKECNQDGYIVRMPDMLKWRLDIKMDGRGGWKSGEDRRD